MSVVIKEWDRDNVVSGHEGVWDRENAVSI